MTLLQSSLEQRRLQAGRDIESGASIPDLVRKYGVSRTSAYQWLRRWRAMRLQATKRTGRRRKAKIPTLREFASLYVQGPRANGYPHDTWTHKLAAQFLQDKFGVEYTVEYCGRLLRKMGLETSRRPTRYV